MIRRHYIIMQLRIRNAFFTCKISDSWVILKYFIVKNFYDKSTKYAGFDKNVPA